MNDLRALIVHKGVVLMSSFASPVSEEEFDFHIWTSQINPQSLSTPQSFRYYNSMFTAKCNCFTCMVLYLLKHLHLVNHAIQ